MARGRTGPGSRHILLRLAGESVAVVDREGRRQSPSTTATTSTTLRVVPLPHKRENNPGYYVLAACVANFAARCFSIQRTLRMEIS